MLQVAGCGRDADPLIPSGGGFYLVAVQRFRCDVLLLAFGYSHIYILFLYCLCGVVGGGLHTHACVSPVCPGDLIPPGACVCPWSLVCAFRGQSRLCVSLRRFSTVGDTLHTMTEFSVVHMRTCVCVCVDHCWQSTKKYNAVLYWLVRRIRVIVVT